MWWGLVSCANFAVLGFCSRTSAVRARFPRLLKLVSSHLLIV